MMINISNRIIHEKIAKAILKQYEKIPYINRFNGDICYVKLNSVRILYDIVNNQPTYYFTINSTLPPGLTFRYLEIYLSKKITFLPHKPKIIIY